MKIAIITHYYKSLNYGGNLQAYALCKVIKNLGYEVEQISFNRKSSRSNFRLKSFLRYLRNIKKNLNKKRIYSLVKERNKKILQFNKLCIPHSEEIYNLDTIKECCENYDVFITGSDQVWHPYAYCSAYGLEFVPYDKRKISYAASIATDVIEYSYQKRLADSLKGFSAISVREKESVSLIKDITDLPIEVSLDPTLLLSRDEWNLISSDRIIEKPYVFCYFLGNEKNHRELAKEYARKNGYTLVSLPYLTNEYRKCDVNFGDVMLYDVSPSDLISLIRYADIIFTDSFHIVAFSSIYEREFIVFDRIVNKSMGTRIRNIVSTLKISDHFCDSDEKQTISYIESLEKINYCNVKKHLELEKEKSMNFLIRNLNS